MRSGMPRLVALAILPFSLYGCSKKQADPPEPKPSEAVVVPTPKGLVAELVLPNPGETWVKLRAAVGGPLAMLPANGGIFATLAFDLPPTAAELFDVNLPAVGAVIEDEGRIAAVLAFHVKDGPKLAELATTGDTGRYVKKPDAQSGVVLLEPKEDLRGPALGVSGNYLTVASRSSDLTRFAPFVTKVLSTRPAPKEDLVALAPREGVAHLVSLLESSWAETKEEVKAMQALVQAQLGPDAPASNRELVFANVDKAIGIASHLDEARLSLVLDNGFVNVRLGAKPKQGDNLATQYLSKMARGDAKPMLSLPAESVVAVAFRDTPESRDESVADTIALLADKLAPAQKERVEQVFRATARVRGEAGAMGVLLTQEGLAFVGQFDKAKEEEFAKTIPELRKLLEDRATASALAAMGSDLEVSPMSAKNGVYGYTFRTKKKPLPTLQHGPDLLPSEMNVFVSFDGPVGRFAAAGRKNAKKLFDEVGKEAGSLAEQADITKLVEGLGNDVSFAALFKPRTLMSKVTGQPATEEVPILVSGGRSESNEAIVRIDMPQSALRDIAMFASGH